MVRILLVTANVGSVFENLDKGLSIWIKEFVLTVQTKNPQFIAVHFQETGGKNYENGNDCIDTFFGQLMKHMEEINFRRAEGFVDSRSDLEDQFTALSSIYFVHESVQPHAIAIWDFQEKSFKEIPSPAKLHVGPELDLTNRKQKEKFPQNFYPNRKWSRKGFLRTKWRIDGKIVDFVNIHLFHDSDNIIAASSFPSQFAQSREKSLKYTITRLQTDSLEKCPIFIFGDFNFRVNTQGVMSILKKEIGEINNELGPFKLKTKKFECPGQEERFLRSYDWLKNYDFEAKQQEDLLQEYDLTFHPSYPFEENENEPEKFLRTRCPAWCDRVLFTRQTKQDIISEESPIEYNVIGSKAYMGDHKPVYLSFTLSKSIHSTTNNSSMTTNLKDPSSTNKLNSLGESSGKLSHNSVEFTNSTSSCSSSKSTPSLLGTPCKCSCKCFVSLIKCNLNFHNKKSKSTNSSSSASIPPPTGLLEESISLNISGNNKNRNKIISTQSNSLVESPKIRNRLTWTSIIGNSRDINSTTNSTSGETEQETFIDKRKNTSNDMVHRIEPLISENKTPSEKNEEKDNLRNNITNNLNQVEKKNEKNDIISARSPVPINISDLNVIISSNEINMCKRSKEKSLQNSKLPFGWMKRKNSKNRSSVSSCKRLSSIKKKDEEELKVKIKSGVLKNNRNRGGGIDDDDETSQSTLCAKCAIL